MSKNKFAEMLNNIQVDERDVHTSILIIDGLNTFLRSFSMINHVNPSGAHIGGLTGFLKSVGYAIKLFNPTKVVIVFDGAGSSESRKKLNPEYKANRGGNRITNYDIFNSKDEETESIKNQVERLIHYLQCLPVSVIAIDGIEADDTIAYLANKFDSFDPTKEVTIMSADKDFLQLTTNKIQIYSPVKKKIYKLKDVYEEYNIPAHNFIMYKVLLGDQSDNLDGVPGLGPKKLLKLFPELSKEEKVNLESIIRKSIDNINEHKLYKTVVERTNQLELNDKLMNLEDVFITPENLAIIKDALNNNSSLDSYTFQQLYLLDGLGNSIPNVASWLNLTFNYLNSF
jgi:DNA polymerase-1